MNKLLPYSDLEILTRVAQRRAMNHKIQQEEINDYRLALDQYIAQQLDAANIDKTLLSNVLSREILFNSLKENFQYVPRPENIIKIDAMKSQANSILPDSIKGEKWSTGDCGCTVQRIYHKEDGPGSSQTFHAKNCSEHLSLLIEDLHDTINDETFRRSSIHRFLNDNFVGIISEIDASGVTKNKEGVDIEFTWEGKNKERILVVDVKGVVLSNQDKQEIVDFSKATFGKKVIKEKETELVKVK